MPLAVPSLTTMVGKSLVLSRNWGPDGVDGIPEKEFLFTLLASSMDLRIHKYDKKKQIKMGAGINLANVSSDLPISPMCRNKTKQKQQQQQQNNLHLGQNFLSHLVKKCNFYPRFYFTHFKQHHRNVSPDINSLLNRRFSKDFLSPA